MVIKKIRGSDYFHNRLRDYTFPTTDVYLELIKVIEEHLKNTKAEIVIKNKGGIYMTVKTPCITDKKKRKLVSDEIKSFLMYEKKHNENLGEQILLTNFIKTFSKAMEDKKQIKQNEVLTCTNKFDLSEEKYIHEYAAKIGKPVKLHESKLAILFEKDKMPKIKEK